MNNFLSCEWRKLVMANYPVDPSLLKKYIPHRTELDLHHGACYVSLVGFMFLNTRAFGVKIPFHVNFEEVNLRFYVRHQEQTEWKRGVVFIKEIVPRPALTFIARTIYGENYVTMPMRRRWTLENNRWSIEYRWKYGQWHTLQAHASSTASAIQSGSDEEFILEHYWGYTRIGERKTSEYKVEHPSWQVYPVTSYEVAVNFEKVYGREFGFLTHEKPQSVMLAEGSEVLVKTKSVLR
ncbi:MAG: YqjF family protein [Bacteroidota bacterium]